MSSSSSFVLRMHAARAKRECNLIEFENRSKERGARDRNVSRDIKTSNKCFFPCESEEAISLKILLE